LERLNDEQKYFRDAMQILIDLYYFVKKIDDNMVVPKDGNPPLTPDKGQLIKINKHSFFIKEDPFFIKPVIMLLARLFHKTIPNFSPCEFFSNPPFFHYRRALEFIHFEKPIGKSNPFQEFIEIVDALKSGLDIPNLFNITKVTREYYAYKKSKIRAHRKDYEMAVDSGPDYRGPHKEIGKHENENEYPWVYGADPKNIERGSKSAISDFPWMNYDDTMGHIHKLTYVKEDVNCRIMPIINGLSDYTSETVLKDLNAPPPYYDLIKFTCIPISISRYFRPSEVVSSIVSSPGYLKEKTDFIDVIKYILVKYVSLFGSFNRIKVCKNCGKLFLEKKYGHGIFCNTLCRVNFHIESEDKNIFRCRARQNRWAERNLTRPYNVQKGDCRGCINHPVAEKIPKGGKCALLLDKNKPDPRRSLK
jgi:hypothetical protein